MTRGAVNHDLGSLDKIEDKSNAFDEIDLRDMYDPRSKWPAEKKIEVASWFILTGSSRAISKKTGVPAETIRWWRTTAHWWPELVAKLRKEKNEELDGRLSGIIEEAVDGISERIKHGDEYLDRTTGQLIRKKLSGRDLTTMMAIMYDKRALMRGDPTSRTEKSTSDTLDFLKQQFADLSKSIQMRTVEGTLIDQEDDDDA
jgi:hypothetical protein